MPLIFKYLRLNEIADLHVCRLQKAVGGLVGLTIAMLVESILLMIRMSDTTTRHRRKRSKFLSTKPAAIFQKAQNELGTTEKAKVLDESTIVDKKGQWNVSKYCPVFIKTQEWELLAFGCRKAKLNWVLFMKVIIAFDWRQCSDYACTYKRKLHTSSF